jgi:hypothetical protein
MLSERIFLPRKVGDTKKNQVVGSSGDFLQHPGIYFPKAVLGPDLNHAKVGITKKEMLGRRGQFIF